MGRSAPFVPQPTPMSMRPGTAICKSEARRDRWVADHVHRGQYFLAPSETMERYESISTLRSHSHSQSQLSTHTAHRHGETGPDAPEARAFAVAFDASFAASNPPLETSLHRPSTWGSQVGMRASRGRREDAYITANHSFGHGGRCSLDPKLRFVSTPGAIYNVLSSPAATKHISASMFSKQQGGRFPKGPAKLDPALQNHPGTKKRVKGGQFSKATRFSARKPEGRPHPSRERCDSPTRTVTSMERYNLHREHARQGGAAARRRAGGGGPSTSSASVGPGAAYSSYAHSEIFEPLRMLGMNPRPKGLRRDPHSEPMLGRTTMFTFMAGPQSSVGGPGIP